MTRLEDHGLLARYLCLTDRRGICTNGTEAGLKLLDETRTTNYTAPREALDDADKRTELTPLVRAVASLDIPAAP